MKCPNCEYERTSQDDDFYPKTECPNCSVIYERINIKETRKFQAERAAQEELARKEQAERNWEQRIQQRAVAIHAMLSSQRIETILGMDRYDREEFLKTEATRNILKNMNFIERRNYLYGGLWSSYRDTMNSALAQGGMLFFVGFVCVAGLGVIISDNHRYSSNQSSAVVANSEFDGSVSQIKSYLKSNAKDPSSLEFISWSPVVETNNGFMVRVKYRAKNSFGALVVEEKVFHLNSSGGIIIASDY